MAHQDPKVFSEQKSLRRPSAGDSISLRSKSSQQSQREDSRENSTKSGEGGSDNSVEGTDEQIHDEDKAKSDEATMETAISHSVDSDDVTSQDAQMESYPTEATNNQKDETGKEVYVVDAPPRPSIEENPDGSQATQPVYTGRPRAPDGQLVPPKPSPDNSETSLSMDILSIDSSQINQPFQETGDQNDRPQSVKLKRMKIIKDIITKSTQPCRVKPMKVAIPRQFSSSTPSFADLIVSYIPYRKEHTEWPDRFFYINLKLSIPPPFVHPMTVNHFCWLVLTLSVTSSSYGAHANDMLENRCAQVKEIDLTESGGDVHYDLCTTLRHSTLIDSCCDKVSFSLSATFKTEKREKQDEEFKLALIDRNFVIISPNK